MIALELLTLQVEQACLLGANCVICPLRLIQLLFLQLVVLHLVLKHVLVLFAELLLVHLRHVEALVLQALARLNRILLHHLVM